MIRIVLGIAALLLSASTLSAADKLEAEQAFAHLLFGEYFRDPCAGMTGNAKSCPPSFSSKRMEYQDDKAMQVYVFDNSPCVIHATTRIASTGNIYEAVFNLQNIQFVNLGRKWRDGEIVGFEFLMQGDNVIISDGTAGNVLYMLHKYRADVSGKIDHDINAEVLGVRKAVKDYQSRFCPSMG